MLAFTTSPACGMAGLVVKASMTARLSQTIKAGAFIVDGRSRRHDTVEAAACSWFECWKSLKAIMALS
jgi:hypothetical protein